MALDFVAGTVLLGFIIMGFALVFFGKPGTYFLLFGAILYDVILWSTTIGPGAIIVLAALVAFGEVFNVLVNTAGSKLSNSFIGNAGALLGSIGGSILGISQGIIGILIGLLVGGAFGAFLLELIHYLSVSKASRAGLGAFFGSTMSTFVKFEISMIMLVTIMLGALF